MEQVIADVKKISLGNKQFYKPCVVGDKAVEIRAAQIPGEYRRGALKVDRELGFPQGGPTLRKLESYEDDLIIGEHNNGDPLERGLGGAHQQVGLMPSVDDKAYNPACVVQPRSSQQQLVGRNGFSIPEKCKSVECERPLHLTTYPSPM